MQQSIAAMRQEAVIPLVYQPTLELRELKIRRLHQRPSPMTPLALSALIATAPRWLSQLGRYWTEFSSGIEEARAMALRYQTLAALSDPELAARGLKRQDIPRAVLGVFGGV
jgi:hypothetical protein